MVIIHFFYPGGKDFAKFFPLLLYTRSADGSSANQRRVRREISLLEIIRTLIADEPSALRLKQTKKSFVASL
ncbi:MAG: hypothetical protein ACR2MG_19065 [Pyrinomonadaceae bacterium]